MKVSRENCAVPTGQTAGGREVPYSKYAIGARENSIRAGGSTSKAVERKMDSVLFPKN